MNDDFIIDALKKGFTLHYNPPSDVMTDDWNKNNAWIVRRNQAFPEPYGAYVTINGRRSFVTMWTGSDPVETLKTAMQELKIPKK